MYIVIIFFFSSEEQIKVFALPRIAPKRKFKMTAVDGSLLRKVVFSRFQSSTNAEYHEYGMALLTNLGGCIYTVRV